jgi:hypothetical protein
MLLAMNRLAIRPHDQIGALGEQQRPGVEAVLLEAREHHRGSGRRRQAEREQRHQRAGGGGVVGGFGAGDALDGAVAELSGYLASRFSVEYDRKVGISAPPAGSAPMGNPNSVPRIHGQNERFQSSLVIHSEPRTGSSFS